MHGPDHSDPTEQTGIWTRGAESPDRSDLRGLRRKLALAASLLLLIGFGAGCADDRHLLEPATDADELASLSTTPTSNATVGFASALAANKCITASGSTRGSPVVIAGCTSSRDQQFTWNGTELKLGGLCVDAYSGRGRDWDRIVLWSCHGGTNQRWRLTSAGELKGINGKCIDIARRNTADGTELILYGCHGGGNQKWVQRTSAAPPASSPISECSRPGKGWIWCDDFEVDRLRSYFEHNQRNGSFVRAAGVGRNGSAGMRARWRAGQVDAGSLKLAFGRTPDAYIRPVDGGTRNYRQIYWRVYVRYAADWQGGGANKMSRATSLVTRSWAQSMIAHVWSGAGTSRRDYLMIDPASGTSEAGKLRTTKYNDFANLRWLGGRFGTLPLFSTSHVGRWYCVEAGVRLNDAGQSNGQFHLWIDNQLQASRSDLNWVGSYDAYGINTIFLENYWNIDPPSRAQERYFDNLVVSTERIGC